MDSSGALKIEVPNPGYQEGGDDFPPDRAATRDSLLRWLTIEGYGIQNISAQWARDEVEDHLSKHIDLYRFDCTPLSSAYQSQEPQINKSAGYKEDQGCKKTSKGKAGIGQVSMETNEQYCQKTAGDNTGVEGEEEETEPTANSSQFFVAQIVAAFVHPILLSKT
jgi:hypothetical protein